MGEGQRSTYFYIIGCHISLTLTQFGEGQGKQCYGTQSPAGMRSSKPLRYDLHSSIHPVILMTLHFYQIINPIPIPPSIRHHNHLFILDS